MNKADLAGVGGKRRCEIPPSTFARRSQGQSFAGCVPAPHRELRVPAPFRELRVPAPFRELRVPAPLRELRVPAPHRELRVPATFLLPR